MADCALEEEKKKHLPYANKYPYVCNPHLWRQSTRRQTHRSQNTRDVLWVKTNEQKENNVFIDYGSLLHDQIIILFICWAPHCQYSTVFIHHSAVNTATPAPTKNKGTGTGVMSCDQSRRREKRNKEVEFSHRRKSEFGWFGKPGSF